MGPGPNEEKDKISYGLGAGCERQQRIKDHSDI